jgi:hypothetical protein
MSIQEKINSLKPYLLSVEFGNIPTAKVVLPEGWGKIPHEHIELGAIGEQTHNGSVCVVYSEHETTTIDDVLNYIGELIRLNLEREEKNQLFHTKVEELNQVFNENTLEKLKTLKFTFLDVKKGEFKLNIDHEGIALGDEHYESPITIHEPEEPTNYTEEVEFIESEEQPFTDDKPETIAVVCANFDDFMDWKRDNGLGEFVGNVNKFTAGNKTYIAVHRPEDAKGYIIDQILQTNNASDNPLSHLIHSHLSLQMREEDY